MTASPVFQIFFGGNRFAPAIDFKGVINGLVQLAVIAIIAAVYPMVVARKIKPLDALQLR